MRRTTFLGKGVWSIVSCIVAPIIIIVGGYVVHRRVLFDDLVLRRIFHPKLLALFLFFARP